VVDKCTIWLTIGGFDHESIILYTQGAQTKNGSVTKIAEYDGNYMFKYLESVLIEKNPFKAFFEVSICVCRCFEECIKVFHGCNNYS